MATTKRTTGLLGQPTLLRFGLFEITFFVAYRFGMSFTQSLASPLWFPDAVLLCVLLGSRSGVWWIYILGTLPIRLFLVVPADTPFWFLVACFVNDSLKALLSAWLLGRITRHGSWFDDLGQFARYFLVAVIVSPGLSAVAGATSRIYRGDEFGGAWIHWFLGDALAALILTPFLVSLSVEYEPLDWKNYARFLKALVIGAGLTGGLCLAFRGDSGGGIYPLSFLYVTVPFLLGAGVLFGLRGATSALLLLSMVAVFGTIDGKGPFHQATPSASQLAIQLFLFFVSVPFMFLAVLVNYQRKTEKSLRESEERFRSMMDTAPVMIWLAGPDGRCSFFNKSWLDFTGRSLPEELGDGWAAGVHPDDRGRWAARYTSALKARAGLTREYRLMRKDRVYRWVLESAAPRSGPNGEPLGYIGSCIDITDRKETEDRMRELSAQLVHAQEAERFRIGQELHDDLSQRAAALSMGLKRLALRYDEGIRPPFEELQQQAADLSLGISNISHQLRPPALETLGLAAALKSLCAQSTSDTVRVTMSSNAELPPLSDDVAISLYRVAQEAIRNALTHSGAALVDLELNLSDSDVQLSITDAGSGFVVDSRALPGLGLSGMSERMKNLGGTLRVVSAPSRGTAITATVPRHKALSATARAS